MLAFISVIVYHNTCKEQLHTTYTKKGSNKMKKTVITIAIVALIFISGFASGIKFLSSHIYSRNGVVVEVNKEEDYITWNDGYFNWELNDTDGWEVGDGITIINFDMMTTNTIEDDYTIEHRYTDM